MKGNLNLEKLTMNILLVFLLIMLISAVRNISNTSNYIKNTFLAINISIALLSISLFVIKFKIYRLDLTFKNVAKNN